MKEVIKLVAFIIYVAGIIIANGFWSTFFAIICPFWAWYLTIEHMLIHYGIL